jgi:hypothetical protein
MDKKGYGEYIGELIRSHAVNKPITTELVAANLAASFGINIKSAKKITNVNLKRLTDKGELLRIRRGLYGKTQQTIFGKLPPNADELMTDYLLHDGEGVIGYITGATLLNAIGMSTMIPRKCHIATNRYALDLPDNMLINISKPVIEVTFDNAPYLQTLDAIDAMNCYPVDADSPESLLHDIIIRKNLSNERLIWYARHYYGTKTLQKTIDIALGDIA